MNNGIKTTKAKELIEITKKIEALKQIEEQLRKELLELLNNEESIIVDDSVVTKKIYKETITDPELLQQMGFDINRVVVTITKVDPKLVSEIGKKENKKYYVEKPRIVVSNKKGGKINL